MRTKTLIYKELLAKQGDGSYASHDEAKEPSPCFVQFLGLLKGFANVAGVSMGEQRTDTTYFMSNIKKAGRMSTAYDVLAKAVKALPVETLPEGLAGILEPSFKTDVLCQLKSDDYYQGIG